MTGYGERTVGLFRVGVMVLLLVILAGRDVEAKEMSGELVALCNQFNTLNTGIRDNRIDEAEAKRGLKGLIERIRKEYYASGGENYPPGEWVFPLEGYDHRAIGGVNGNGYRAKGYDYFDGDRHGGHPSQDIFIRDRSQRGRDDRTGEPVRVLSLTGGVVVALEKSWGPTSGLRGGKYVWIFDPTSNALIYYAHNSIVSATIGDLVKPGDPLAEVGRTGRNAHRKRSPTHLHLTYLKLIDGVPSPQNIYRELLASRPR